jgi:glycosyltransferase involved in cell wall biosynthesis
VAVLSVIVPVYRVRDYLPECLDSLLGDAGADIEVVAVDDASPDDSSEILARYAATDPRLRVVTLTENVGLGGARNTGLDRAVGEYVWFVDSDDWLPAGTVPAVLRRLVASTPDVLVVDYERCFHDGRRVRAAIAELFAEPLPDVFTLAERPALLRSLTIACNKVVRRAFLVELGIRFAPGFYEDISWSIPLLVAAEKIGVLDRVCYCYRQRPGAITFTITDRHFDVFPQWQRVFDFLDTRPACAALRPVVFERMIWHLLAVLGHAERVPRRRRRAFFAEMTVLYRRHRPAEGYPAPGGVEGLKRRLVGLGAYPVFEVLRRAGGRGRRTPVRAAR